MLVLLKPYINKVENLGEMDTLIEKKGWQNSFEE